MVNEMYGESSETLHIILFIILCCSMYLEIYA